jgi:uncharacterized protein
VLPDLERLIRLQDVESRAAHARQTIAEAPGRIRALDEKLDTARAAVDAAKAALAANQTARRDLEKEGAVAQQRVSKYKDQLMEAKTNREYHALQHEITTFSDEVQRIETLTIEKLLEADELAAALNAAETTLAEETKALGEERKAIEEEARELEGVVTDMAAAREAIAKELDRVRLAMFDSLFKGRRQIAVAPIEAGLCSACHVRVRPQVLNTLLKNEMVFQCENCQRILYTAAAKPEAGGQASEVGSR